MDPFKEIMNFTKANKERIIAFVKETIYDRIKEDVPLYMFYAIFCPRPLKIAN